MTEILRQKIIKLVRGDDGVALVVTLALFMFLYVSCAGVYTVGRAVKDRIILQNAVDAAAYSAAVVQADYLSRIATINKAMAWNYVQFLKSQRKWIALRLMLEIDKDPTRVQNTGLTVSDTIKPVWDVNADVRANLPAGDKLDQLRDEIDTHRKELENLENALEDLISGMEAKIKNAINTVLIANLPFRIGELCRFHFKQPMPDDILDVMDSGTEDQFLRWTDDPNVEDLIELESYWFQTTEGKGFQRLIGETSLRTSPTWLTWNPPYESPHPRLPIVDAHEFASEIPYYGLKTEPLTLLKEYFPSEDDSHAATGAVTVAVAKWNENPWKQLIGDLTGIHAVFDYGEKNDWTFAIASAQAGYHLEGGEDRQYSLNGEGFEENNLSVTDWDAVYLPVRMAFGSDDDAFATWMKDSAAWEKLVPDGERKYVSEPLEEIRFYELNHEALARMHNNGGTKKILKWNEDESKRFLDLMYH